MAPITRCAAFACLLAVAASVSSPTRAAETDQARAADRVIHLATIYCSTRDTCERAAREIRGGARFEAVAREHSEDPNAQAGGDAGYFVATDLAPELRRAVGPLGEGEFSDVVETARGFHIVKILETLSPEEHRRRTEERRACDSAARLLDNGDARLALAEARRALEIAPDSFRAHFIAGDASYVLGDLEQSESMFREALRLAPEQSNPELPYRLAYVILERAGVREDRDGAASESDLRAALGFLDRAIELDPGHFLALEHRALVLDLLGRYDEAIAAYESLIATETPNLGVYGRLFVLYEKTGDFDEAVRRLEDLGKRTGTDLTFAAARACGWLLDREDWARTARLSRAVLSASRGAGVAIPLIDEGSDGEDRIEQLVRYLRDGPPTGEALLVGTLFMAETRAGRPVVDPQELDYDTAPELISKVTPEYPELARLARIEAEIMVVATIGPGGNVKHAVAVPHPSELFGFSQAAVSAVRQWRFRPATKAGAAVEAKRLITITFELQ